ncbi:MAG: DegT/DnrJ/EryC1/StrS family aminotransferase [Candidatus Paceibacterota bacterium]
MFNNLKPILISLSPNVQRDDLWLAFKLLFQPWKWKEGSSVEKLEEEFKNYLDLDYSFSFNSGRSAFLAILESLDLKEGEVLLQGFTCNAAVNPVLEAGLKPIYVDIDDTLNMDVSDLKKKIGKKSKVVVAQHTFGNPANLEEIKEVCEKHNLILIEDCAHSLGAQVPSVPENSSRPPQTQNNKGRKVGSFGKAAFFSLGRDKVISSVYGGVAVTDDPVMGERIKKYHSEFKMPGAFWIFQQLLHPLLTTLAKPFYGFGQLGRYFLGGLQKVGVLSKSVAEEEKEGRLPSNFPTKIPNALAKLGLNQFNKLEEFNSHREAIADFYNKNLSDLNVELPADSNRIFMRYSLLTPKDTDEILNKAEKNKIFLNDGWRKKPVVPPDTELRKVNYAWGVCPQAEQVAEEIINLPTHPNITLNKAQRIVNFLKDNL